MYLDDAPITSSVEDKLGRDQFVKRLAETINSVDTHNSLIIGLYGPWGSGKSSVLNMLEEKLKPNDTRKGKNIVVQFDPWFFNSAEELLQSFLIVVQKQISTVFSDPKTDSRLRKLFDQYAKQLSFSVKPKISLLGGLISFGADFSRKQKSDQGPEVLRREINQLLEDISGRVIILIDNLDRLEPTELLLMLKLVRLCSDFSNFIYVLSFDQKQVINVLDKSANIDSEYLSKIIQVDINLPYIEQSSIDDFVGNSISEIAEKYNIAFEENLSERYSAVYQSSIKSELISDLRTAKRYLNAIAFSMPMVRNEVNFADFLTIEAVRVFLPTIYQGLSSCKEALTELDGISTGDWRRRERLESFKALTNWVEYEIGFNNDDPHDFADLKKSIDGILGMLFPTYGNYLSNPTNPAHIGGLYYHQEFERGQRICSPAHFDRYFRFQVPGDAIPTNMVKGFIQALNSSNMADIDEVTRSVSAYKDEDKLIPFIEKLVLYSDELNHVGKKILRNVLIAISPTLNWTRTHDWTSEARTALILITDHLLDKENIETLENESLEIVQNCPSLSFASSFVEMANPNRDYRKFPEAFKYSVLVKALGIRIENELLSQNINVFEKYPNSYGTILYSWRAPDILDGSASANKYIYETLEKDQGAIINLLSGFVLSSLGTNEPRSFNFDEFGERYDLDRIYNLVDDFDLGEDASEIERFAVNEFFRFYKESKRSNSDQDGMVGSTQHSNDTKP